VIMGVVPCLSELSRYKADLDKTVRRALAQNDVCASLVDGNEPATKWVGILKLRFFFREAAGRGWALVGDAGLHKDPTPGLGMTDALRDAKNLAKAIVAGGDRTLERYWRQRDVDSLELFSFANQMGSERFASAFQETIFDHVNQSEALKARMARQADREISPYEVFGLDVVLPCLAKTVLRGHFEAVGDFFRMGKQGAEVKERLAERRALLSRVSA
jgi:flavin-dependent dehydrogenase